MLDSILTTTTQDVSIASVAICTLVSLAAGIVIALVYMYKNTYSKNFIITIAIIPAIVQSVIMIVNGNLGVGVAVMGAFSLVRFRSVPGSSKEILTIFFAMAVGLAAGMGYVFYASVFTVVISTILFAYTFLQAKSEGTGKRLKITIPEDLDYVEVFKDIFEQYTKKATLEKVKTTNLGSLYELHYTVVQRDESREKEFLDKIRQRNSNLAIVCSRIAEARDEL